MEGMPRGQEALDLKSTPATIVPLSHPQLLPRSPVLSRPFLPPPSWAEDLFIIKNAHHRTPTPPSQGLPTRKTRDTLKPQLAFGSPVGVSAHAGEAFVGMRALAMHPAVVFKLCYASESLVVLVKTDCWAPLQGFSKSEVEPENVHL